MKPIPRKILIKNKIYKVSVRKHLRRDCTDLDGWADLINKLVHLFKGQSDEDLRLSMVHELIHACHHEHGLRTSENMEAEESCVKEIESIIKRFFVPR